MFGLTKKIDRAGWGVWIQEFLKYFTRLWLESCCVINFADNMNICFLGYTSTLSSYCLCLEWRHSFVYSSVLKFSGCCICSAQVPYINEILDKNFVWILRMISPTAWIIWVFSFRRWFIDKRWAISVVIAWRWILVIFYEYRLSRLMHRYGLIWESNSPIASLLRQTCLYELLKMLAVSARRM